MISYKYVDSEKQFFDNEKDFLKFNNTEGKINFITHETGLKGGAHEFLKNVLAKKQEKRMCILN